MPIALSVNLNKIALIRNSREGDYPSVLEFGKQCINLGVQGLTVHPRPDQRHIRPVDCVDLAQLVKNNVAVEFNIEGNPLEGPRDGYPGFVHIVLANKPDQVTLVPDSNHQKTSDHGFDLNNAGSILAPIIEQLKANGLRVSLFMDPIPEQIKLAHSIGADRIELYTGPFAHAYALGEGKPVFAQHVKAAEQAIALGLGINAGHDLNLDNMTLYRQLPGLAEVSIGHALTVDALKMGWHNAVQAYLDVCNF